MQVRLIHAGARRPRRRLIHARALRLTREVRYDLLSLENGV